MNKQKAFAVLHKNDVIRMQSRSGGIFTAVSDWVISKNGLVCGAEFTDDWKVKHSIADNASDRDKFRGSKYIQSDMGTCFQEVCQYLKEDRYVLFTGTACQVAGLKKYIELTHISTDKLILLDLVCHGVASPQIWRDCIEDAEKRYKGKVTNVEFRNKKDYGWHDHYHTLWINGKKHTSEQWTKLFYDHDILRPSCYSCPYASIERISDFTIADFWGIERVAPELYDNNGASLVILNTEKAQIIFNEIKDMIIYKECPVNESIIDQPNLHHPTRKPISRDIFWSDYQNNGYNYVIKKYSINPLKSLIKREIKVLLRKVHLRRM